jgi:hypothetical protein
MFCIILAGGAQATLVGGRIRRHGGRRSGMLTEKLLARRSSLTLRE